MILLNAPLVGERLGYAELSGLDLLELFAFVHPATFMVPTPKGLATALGLPVPKDDLEAALLLPRAAAVLLDRLSAPDWTEREGAWASAGSLTRLRWPWGAAVSERIAKPAEAERWLFSKLPEWQEGATRPAPRIVTLNGEDVLDQLDALTGHGAEERPGQRDYATATMDAFAPRNRKDAPNLVLAEADGVRHTLARVLGCAGQARL